MTITPKRWEIPDPENKLVDVRRKVKAYAAANGIELAEALVRIVKLAKI